MQQLIDQASKARTWILTIDIILSLLIISSSMMLVKTSFGNMALIFGFFMLILTAILRIFHKW